MTPPPLQGPLRLPVRRESDVPTVVAAVHGFCRAAGMSPVQAAHVATAASELANNLWMHTTHGGALVVQACSRPQVPGGGVELVCSDDGPGIPDIDLAMRDGYSTGGGMGCGLPGVRRLMDEFHITSAPGQGTCVRARKWAAAGVLADGLPAAGGRH